MKTLFAVCVAAGLALSVNGQAQAQTKKYDVKSGILTLEISVKTGGMDLKSTATVYFDDYGMKECREKYTGDKLTESYFSDGKTLYTVIHSKKTAYRRGDALRGTEMRFDQNELPEKDRAVEKITLLPNVVIAGKTCASFVKQGISETTTFAGWGHITFLVAVDGKTVKSATKVTSFKENVSIPPEKFAVPAGYEIKQSQM